MPGIGIGIGIGLSRLNRAAFRGWMSYSDTTLTAVPASDTAMDLAWINPNISGVTLKNVVVEISTDGVAFATSATLGVVTSTQVTGLTTGTLYYFRLVFVNSRGIRSGNGGVVSARTINYVAYIESSGTQYIDIGIIPQSEQFELEMSLVKFPPVLVGLFGTKASASNQQYTYFNNNRIPIYALGSNYYTIKSDGLTLEQFYKIELNSANELKLDNVKVADVPTGQSYPNNITDKIFKGGTATPGSFRIKYYRKTTQYYLKAAINNEGQFCMFDEITKTFKLNAGTGYFKGYGLSNNNVDNLFTQYANAGVSGVTIDFSGDANVYRTMLSDNAVLQLIENGCTVVCAVQISSDSQVAKVIGDELYIGSKYGTNKDVLISFKKCMFNELMTFSGVSLSDNPLAFPLSNPERTPDLYLNTAGSDNIGPIYISGGGWTGGNHSWNDELTVKTAETISFSFYADDVLISDGDTVNGNIIKVVVSNKIYDPRVAPLEGQTILSEEVCMEDVIYIIENGNIKVELTHTYSKNATISTYYGMQSNFYLDTTRMTPEGEFVDFTASPTSFIKSSYPNFNRFIERNAAKSGYQSSYLIPSVGIGDHTLIGDSSYIFVSSSSKTYHKIIDNHSIGIGDAYSWAGLYTWFLPYSDDEDKIVYVGKMDSDVYLFIDLKAVTDTTIEIPYSLTGLEYTIISQSDTITTIGEPSVNGIPIVSTGAGSLVLKY